MKKIINSVAILSLVLASMSFAISTKDTTILGKNYAKITSCSDLGQLRSWTNDGKVVNAIVMQDINCNGAKFSPIGQSEDVAYEGIFDGNGKTISGMKLGTSDSYTGMFGVIGTAAQVKNVTIANSSVNASSQYAGILVGLNYGVVTNCTVEASNTVKSSGTDVGGIAGRNGGYGTMSGCTNYAAVNGSDASEVGGIAGACTGAISNSVNYGKVTGGSYAGGIVGSVHYRTAETLVSGKDSVFVPGRIALCQNVGEVSGSSSAGGIAGENMDGSIDNSRNDGAVSSRDGVAGGVVGYSHFDGERYTDGKYKTVVSNSFNTATVSGNTIGGVAGAVEHEGVCVKWGILHCRQYSYDSTFSRIENSYYDNVKLSGKNVKAVGSSSKSKISAVSGKPTKDMFSNDAFVALLNGGSSYIAWLFDNADYPRLNCGADQGNFKVTFIVNGVAFYEATTVKNKMQGAVSDPAGAFKGWMDDENKMFTSAEANARTYSRSVTYNAVFKQLFEITFVTDFGVTLDKKSFEEGAQIFYSRIGDDGEQIETPADFDTDTATYKFVKWDREFGLATKAETYTAQFEKVMKAFDVKFFVQGEQYGETQKVNINEGAVAPADPVVNGFRFKGWDKDFSKVTANLDVDAILEAVAYVCRDDGEVKCDTIPVPGEFIVPETGSNDSITCVWVDKQNNKEYKAGDVIPVEEFMTITLELVCTVNKFDVTFVAKEELVEEQSVAYGDAAETPAVEKIPVFEGFRFTNWVEDYSRITANLQVNANYIPTVEVCFGAEEFKATDCKTFDKDSTYDMPELPEEQGEEGFTCTEWTLNGNSFEGKTFTAAEKMEFVAKCHKNFFDVKFFVLNVQKGETQKVAYGAAATAPEVKVDGYRFDGWLDSSFVNVVADLEVNAKMTELVEVCFGDDCKFVPVDTTIVVPEVPESESTTCSAWKMADMFVNPGDTIKVNANMTFEAVCVIKTFEVKFIAFDTVDVDLQKVSYGADANLDSASAKLPEFEGFRFDGWMDDGKRITAARTIDAIMTKLAEVCYAAADTAIKCDTIPADTTITIPEFPGSDSLTCTTWFDGENYYKPGDTVKAGDIKGDLVAVCTVNEFDVKFFVLEAMIDSQKVAYGDSAKTPAAEKVAREGYRFDGWDTTFTRIIADLSVNAIMTKLATVCFEVADTTIVCDTIPADTTITIPEFPGSDSLTCTTWFDGENYYKPGDTVKAGDIKGELVAVCTVNEFDVKFFVLEAMIDSQKVAYGDSATAPADSLVAREGYRFDGWDTTFTRIISDLNVNAKMKALMEVCTEFAANEPDCITVPVDTTITIPELPGNDSLTCTAWSDGKNTYLPGQEVLASEIAGTLVAVCSVNEFAVKFIVLNDTVKTDSVAYGAAATEPAAEEVAREGYRFDGWDTTFARIIADLDVNAKMTAMTVVCKEYDGEIVCDTIPADTTIIIPEFPGSDSVTCTVWSNGDTTFVPGDSVKASEIDTLFAVCELNKYDVKFVAFDSVLVDSQKVAYGSAATEPADSLIPSFEGYRFLDWDADFTSITSNLVVNAMFDTLVKININIAEINVDTTIFVLKDTVITGLDSMKKVIESVVGEGLQCKVTVDGEELVSDSLAISKDIDVDVKCNLLVKEVTFYVADSILGTVKVLYGFAADFDAPVFPNKRFVGWDIDLNRVIDDVDAHAKYVDVDTVFVMVNGAAIDSVEIAKGDSVEYVLRTVDNTEDSTFLAWNVDGESHNAKDVVFLKYGSEVFADFEKTNAIRGKRLAAGFAIHSENSQLMISGARVGDLMTVLDLQGRVIAQKRVQNSVEIVNIANRGNYLVRVGYQTKRVVVR